MPDLEPITREEKLWSGEDIEPITREEMYIKHIFDKTQTIPSKPLTRKEMLLEKAGEGGGSDVTIKQLSVTENGTYSEENTAYSPVIVNVPAPPIPDNAYLLNDLSGLPADIATFTDGSSLPMPSLKVGIEPIQSGSGDPSPSNVRPISGWTEAEVTRTGKNLFNPSSLTEGKTINSDGSIDTQANRSATVEGIPIQPNSRYTISYVESIRQGIFYYDKDDNFISFLAWGNNPRAFLTPSNAYYVRFSFEDGTAPTNVMLSIGETAQPYTAYNGQTYTIDLDGTRYGGTLDVVSGALTVDRGYVDLGTLNYTYYSGNLFTALISSLKPIPNERLCNALCSIYVAKKGIEYASIDGSFVAGFNNSRTLAIHDSRFTDATAFKTAMNGVQLVYELATPLTIQLTPTAIKSLDGVNNVWGDCGQISEGSYFAKSEEE